MAKPRGEAQPATEPGSGVADDPELTLTEASTTFAVSPATLARLLSSGLLTARKVTGVRGKEWRIPTSALEQAGYARREDELQHVGDVRRLTDALQAERARSARLDGELGYALLTVGRLRGRLRDAGVDPDELFGADLEAGPEAGP